MKHFFAGICVVAVVSAIMFYGWLRYSEPRNKGLEIPDSAKVLDILEGSGALDFEIKAHDGRILTFLELKGKVVILNFWASWCSPCVEEFPSMFKLVKEFNGEVVLVAVSQDKDRKEMEKFIQIFDGEYSKDVFFLKDRDKAIASLYKIDALPESFIFGRDLKLVQKKSGADDWASEGAIRYFEELTQLSSEN